MQSRLLFCREMNSRLFCQNSPGSQVLKRVKTPKTPTYLETPLFIVRITILTLPISHFRIWYSFLPVFQGTKQIKEVPSRWGTQLGPCACPASPSSALPALGRKERPCPRLENSRAVLRPQPCPHSSGLRAPPGFPAREYKPAHRQSSPDWDFLLSVGRHSLSYFIANACDLILCC